jgi:hypothetical protein
LGTIDGVQPVLRITNSTQQNRDSSPSRPIRSEARNLRTADQFPNLSREGAALQREMMMAVNKPVGDNARKGAVKKRTQRKTAVMGKAAWTKRDKTSGEFIAVKKSAKKFKGVSREK